MMPLLWSIAAVAAGLYCIARAIEDVRHKRYAWASFGVLSAAIFLFAPMTERSVTVTIPADTPR